MSTRTRAEEDNRVLLFGTRAEGAHRRPVGGVAPSVNVSVNEREMVEAANEEKVDGLRGRVGEIRHLALDIGSEVGEQNRLLEGMSGSFEGVSDALDRTIAELKRLARSGGGGHMCILFVFAFLFFILVYLLLR